MIVSAPSSISTIIVNLSDVLIRGIDDNLMTNLARGNYAIEFKPVKQSAFCDPAALDVLTQASKGLSGSGDDYLKAVIKSGNWKISPDDLRNAVLQNFRDEVPGMRALLHELRNKGLSLILESNHLREWIEEIDAAHPFLTNIFRRRFLSFETGRLNKSAEAFEKIAASAEKSPSECLYVGNSKNSCEAAERAGMKAFHFQDANQLRAVLVDLNLI